MKPIRSNELEFFKDMIREKFYDKKEVLKTQMTTEAQKLSDKKAPLMAKQCGVDNELKKLKIADEKYREFVETKQLQEKKLLEAVEDLGRILTSKLERMSSARTWELSFSDFKPRTDGDGVGYFEKRLNDACYNEAYKQIKSNHKVYNDLNNMKSECEIILHTGSDINSVVTTLKSAMSKADIELPVPSNLLQLAVK
mgnify:FL=1